MAHFSWLPGSFGETARAQEQRKQMQRIHLADLQAATSLVAPSTSSHAPALYELESLSQGILPLQIASPLLQPDLLPDRSSRISVSSPAPRLSHQRAKSSSHKRSSPTSPLSTSTHVRKSTDSDARCQVCGNSFSRRSNLYKHIRSVHGAVRKFACPTCGFRFKRQDHLDKHVRSVHARVRSFSCDVCGDLFSEKFNRDKHRKTIHQSKRAYRCKCGYYFQGWEKMSGCLKCK